jgi:hypothetical protein
MGEMRGAYRVFLGKPKRKDPLGRPRRIWEDKFRWIFRTSDGVIDWIDLAENRDR